MAVGETKRRVMCIGNPPRPGSMLAQLLEIERPRNPLLLPTLQDLALRDPRAAYRLEVMGTFVPAQPPKVRLEPAPPRQACERCGYMGRVRFKAPKGEVPYCMNCVPEGPCEEAKRHG